MIKTGPRALGTAISTCDLDQQLPVWDWVGGGETSRRYRDSHSNILPCGTRTASGSQELNGNEELGPEGATFSTPGSLGQLLGE